MLAFVRIILVVYLIAINLYSFILLRSQKISFDEGNECAVKDGKLFIAGLLGGALAIYVSMFIFKFRLQSLFLMVIMPVLIVVNAYIVITCFSQNFGFIIETSAFFATRLVL